jgi:hypothetical protein
VEQLLPVDILAKANVMNAKPKDPTLDAKIPYALRDVGSLNYFEVIDKSRDAEEQKLLKHLLNIERWKFIVPLLLGLTNGLYIVVLVVVLCSVDQYFKLTFDGEESFTLRPHTSKHNY